MADFKLDSPDTLKTVELRYVTELHFGPMIFTIKSKGFELPSNIGEVLEFIHWSNNSQYLSLCTHEYDSISSTHLFTLYLIDTFASVTTKILTSDSPIKVKTISDSGEIVID